MTNDQLIDHLKKEIRRVKIQRNMYQEEYGKLLKRTIRAEAELQMMKKGSKLTVNPEYAHLFTAPSLTIGTKGLSKWKKAPPFEDTLVVSRDHSGKWSTPPDHPDNGGALIGTDNKKWWEIYTGWRSAKDQLCFPTFLDDHYESPKRFNLPTWVRVQKWAKSLTDYKDVSFLDFLIKFYPAPEPRR